MSDEWTERPLRSVCSVVTDGSHHSPTTIPEGLPYVTVRDVKGGRIDLGGAARISKEDFEKLESAGCCPEPGDVLFSKDGTVGRVALVECAQPFVVLSSLAILRPLKHLVLPAYLAYAVQSPDFQNSATGQKTGLAIKRVVLKNLKQMTIPVPPLPVQRRIVDLMTHLDSHLANLRAEYLTLRKFGDSLLETLMSNAAGDSAAMRLGDFCRFLNGDRSSNYPKASERHSSGIPFVNAGHLQVREINFAAMDYIGQDTFVRLNGGKFIINDVLFCLRGSVGKFALVRGNEEGAIASSLVIIRCSPELEPAFLMAYLDSIQFRNELEKYMTGAAQPNLSVASLSQFEIFVPSLAEQARVGATMSKVHESASSLRAEIESLELARNTIMASLFEGSISLTDSYDSIRTEVA